MVEATIVVREQDKDTQTFTVLDIIKINVPNNPKELKSTLDKTLSRFFLESHNKMSDIHDIHIEFKRS